MIHKAGIVGLFVCLLATVGGLTGASTAAGHETYDAAVVNPQDGTRIAITVFTPVTASASAPAPVVLHSHGWGGSRTTEIDDIIGAYLGAGFGVISIDQRGHGESDGRANVQDPTKETEDIQAVIDYAAALDWVAHDTDSSGRLIPNDPVLGAIGGSYGGGYQTMTALDEIAEEGGTRFNALAPQISWFDLPESLAPNKVVRTAWVAALYGTGAVNLPRYVHEAFAWGAATGQWPDGTLYGRPVAAAPDIDSEFNTHSPVWFVKRGIRIDVPVLIRQGASDNLFNLNQGLHLFERALTEGARRQSYFVSYNGGHALPNAVPPGDPLALGEDACSPDFDALTIDFFRAAFAGQSTQGLLPRSYNLTTADGSACLNLSDLRGGTRVPLRLPGGENAITTAGLGAPLSIPIGKGPVTIAGIPKLSGTVTSQGLDARAFFGLSVGQTPADARVVQNNLMPLRRVRSVENDEFVIELPGVAVEVPNGQTLFLTITPVSDMYFGHGSRTPGVLQLRDLQVHLPTPGKG